VTLVDTRGTGGRGPGAHESPTKLPCRPCRWAALLASLRRGTDSALTRNPHDPIDRPLILIDGLGQERMAFASLPLPYPQIPVGCPRGIEPPTSLERLTERDARQPVATSRGCPRLSDLPRRRLVVPWHPDSPT